jgi:hypothetical protein
MRCEPTRRLKASLLAATASAHTVLSVQDFMRLARLKYCCKQKGRGRDTWDHTRYIPTILLPPNHYSIRRPSTFSFKNNIL